METSTIKQWINNPLCLDTYLLTWIEAFLLDREAMIAKGLLVS